MTSSAAAPLPKSISLVCSMSTPLVHGARALRCAAMPVSTDQRSAKTHYRSGIVRRVFGGAFWFFNAFVVWAPAVAAAPRSDYIDPPAHGLPGRRNPLIAADSLVAASLATIVAHGELESMRWSQFSDVGSALQHLYEPRNFTPLWSANGVATPSARAMVASLLGRVASHGP